MGGSGPHEGHIFVGSQPVCGRDYGHKNALVVCRLDYFYDILYKAVSKRCSQDVRVH